MAPPVVPASSALPGVERKSPVRSAPKVPTVLPIEDSRVWREFTDVLIIRWPEFSHVGSAANGLDGIALCREKQPDIVVLDLGLPDIDGFTLLDELSALPHPPRILLLTCRQDDALLHRVISGGIGGLIPKRDGSDFDRHLRLALAAVAAGKSYFPPEVGEAIKRFRRDPDAFHKILSPLEQFLLSRTGRGCTDAQIACCTGRCASTVRGHFAEIIGRLQLGNRRALLGWTQAKGLLRDCHRIGCGAGEEFPKSSSDSKQNV